MNNGGSTAAGTGRRHILLTGGTGFVGKHFQQELRKRGLSFFAFSRKEFDLTNWAQTEAVFKQNQHATAIIHLASFQAAGNFPAEHPAEQTFINNLIHTHMLEGWKRYTPKAQLLAVGTSCAYPSSAAKLEEKVFLDGAIHGSVYAYAFTKRLLYNGILAYNDQFKLNGTYLIPATMFGEHDDFHPATSHVPGALVGKFVRAARENLPEVEIWGDGSQVRDFVDVKEFVRIVLGLVGRADRDIINIGPGAGVSVRQLATLISEAAEYKGRLAFNPQRYTGIKEKYIEAGKLKEKYGLTVNPDIKEGIARTVAWYSDNYESVKDRPKFQDLALASK